MVSDVAELLSEALSRWGKPAAIAADRFKKAELIGHLNALAFPTAALVLRGMGYRDGSEDVRAFQLAALQGHVTPVKSLLLRASMSEARLIGDPSGNWKLAKGSEGGRRSRAKDDVVAACNPGSSGRAARLRRFNRASLRIGRIARSQLHLGATDSFESNGTTVSHLKG